MNGFTYLININVGGMGAIGKLLSMVDSLENRLGKVENEVGQFGRSLEQAGRRGQIAFGGMGSSLNGLLAGVGATTLAVSSLKAVAEASGQETTIGYLSKSSEMATQNMDFLRSTSDRLGVSIQATQDGFAQFMASTDGTGISMQQTRDIFEGVMTGASALNIGVEKSSRAFYALSQMASKGVVSAEELRGQLGDAIPGAANIAAKAMGLPIEKFNKMLEDGDILAKDMLPRFAQELNNAFGPLAAAQADSATANFTRMQNALYGLKVTIGQELLPVATQLIKDFLIPGATWFRENRDAVFDVAKAFGVLYVATKTLVAANLLQDAITKGLTFSVWGLNAAMLANPVTWVVAGLLALGGAIYYAWNHFEGFRNVVWRVWEGLKPLYAGFIGLWEALKTLYNMAWNVQSALGSLLYDAVEPFAKFVGGYWITEMKVLVWVFGKLWEGLMWVDSLLQPVRDSFWSLIGAIKAFGIFAWEHVIKPLTLVGKLFTMLAPLFEKAGASLSNSFTEGWNQGMADFAGNVAAPATGLVSNGGAPQSPFVPATAPGGTPGSQKATKVAEGITGGGQRNVTVHLGALINGLTLHSQNVTEGADEVVELLTRKLLQVLNSANQVQTAN